MKPTTLSFIPALLLAISCQHKQPQPPVAKTTETAKAHPSTEPQDSSCTAKLTGRALRKDTAGVRSLLEAGCDPNTLEKDVQRTYSPLRVASDPVTVKLLLDYGADPNQSGDDVMPPFHYAACCLTTEIMQMMWEKGADVNKVFLDNSGHEFDTPLLCAIWSGQPEKVKWLIEHGANVNYRTEDLSPLTEAVAIGNASMVEMLLKKGVDVNARFTLDHEDCYSCPIGITPIFHILYSTNFDKKIIDLLIKYGADINYVCEGGYTVLDEVRDVAMAQYLLQKGASMETKKTSALAAAAFRYDVDLVKLYLKHGANPNFKKNPALVALLHGPFDEYSQNPEKTLEIIQLLLDHGADPALEVKYYDDEPMSALLIAKSGYRMFVTEYFIEKGYLKWSELKMEPCDGFSKDMRVIAPSGLMVRLAPSQKAPALGKLENGAVVHTCNNVYGKYEEVDGIKAAWSCIDYNGKNGYVFSGFLQ